MKNPHRQNKIPRTLTPNSRLRLILVRHGESLANAAGVLQGQSEGQLTEKGVRQADWLGAHLQAFQIDRILASDLQRARETAAQIARHLTAPIEYSALVREWNAGNLDGQPAAALPAAVRASGLPLFAFKPQGGESLVEVVDRAGKLLQGLEKGNRRETVLVVSHGDFMRMVLGIIQKIAPEKANTIHLDNTSYSVAELDREGNWNLLAINNTDHLVDD